MARKHPRRVAEGKQNLRDRTDQRGVITARKIRSANRAGEQRVADEQILLFCPLGADRETDAARAMTRRVMDADLVPAEL